MKQIPLPIGLQPQPAFDNFMPGANAGALQHVLALDAVAAPVYLWGPGGSGKTHLLRAWAAARQAAGQRVGWF
ncbi:MAG TPA: DnaA/Hda family protein, partial [Rubrivivax sp.]|nr:DnaA/Hda family protein [Rubrivivax sp.]